MQHFPVLCRESYKKTFSLPFFIKLNAAFQIYCCKNMLNLAKNACYKKLVLKCNRFFANHITFCISK